MGVVNFTLRAIGLLFSAFLYSYLDVLDRQKVEEPEAQGEGLTITYTRYVHGNRPYHRSMPPCLRG